MSHHEEYKTSLSIVLDEPFLTLKGTGPDVEPTTLSGRVVLYLTEATALKGVTLQFRGKATIPVPAVNESILNHNSSITSVVCNHEWSFLESFSTSKRHAHTLKAGPHYFPFSLSIDGSLPSSLSTPALGGASITYKLHAVAVRPGLMHNFQHATPVLILRSFAPESLEYQQTLEIEDSWAGKLMYSIMIPHKAWAAGDVLGAVLKLSPLAKGVQVVNVVGTLVESAKVHAHAWSGSREEKRVVCSARHEFGRPSAQDHHTLAGPSNLRQVEGMEEEGYENNDIVTYLKLPIPPSAKPGFTLSDHASSNSTSTPKAPAVLVTPSQNLEPITVSHRMRWSIYIRNPDGHISELRCGLPVTIMDGNLLSAARNASLVSRRMMVRSCGIVDEELWGLPVIGSVIPLVTSRGERGELEEDSLHRELPSYTAHVRDRVAYMFWPEAATVRVSNPWLAHVDAATRDPESSNARAHGAFSSTSTSTISGAPASNGSAPLTVTTKAHAQPTRVLSFSSDSSAPSFVDASRAEDPHLPHPTMTLRSLYSQNCDLYSHSTSSPAPTSTLTLPTAPTPTPTPLSASLALKLLHQALTEVPDYAFASKGFLGGVPPLTSTCGLPSYEQAVEGRAAGVRGGASEEVGGGAGA